MDYEERQKRLGYALALRRWQQGKMSRREFLRTAIAAGFGASLAGLFGCRRTGSSPNATGIRNTTGSESTTEQNDQRRFLIEMGKRFAGRPLRVVSEDTPPSRVTREIMFQEFIPLTKIQVKWDTLPLDEVLARVSTDTARQTGFNDVYYIDESWVGRFADDFVSPTELFQKPDLAYPGYDFPDILPQLVEGIATYQGRLIGIPYDTPLFIMMYRQDVLEKLHLRPPQTIPEYANTVKAITQETQPEIYGAIGGWKSGHLSLYIDYSSFLWAHGGSIFRTGGEPSVADERAVACLEFMMELAKYMPPGVTTWDWTGEALNFAAGRAAIMIEAGEWFSVFDDPQISRVVGLVQAAPCPREIALRKPSECAFSEHPGMSRQGGSSLCISRYSKAIDLAWVFLQWATSPDVTARACVLGGGSSPIRASNYRDPRVLAHSKDVTRHFPVTLDAIEHRMGTDPKFPGWEKLSVDSFAVELGKLTTRQQSIPDTVSAMANAARLATRGLRSTATK